MKTTDRSPRRRPGRPLSFDRDAALEQAMRLFWRHGYEATSLRDLTTAMGVSPPSLYAAFGDKKALFRAAVARYVGEPATADALIDAAPTARDAAWALLETSAIGFTGRDTPRGCLLASAAIGCAPDAADVQREIAAIRRRTETRLRDRIAGALADGELDAADAGGDPAALAETLAAHVMAVIQGMSTLARDGAPREKLLRVAGAALRGWPLPGGRPAATAVRRAAARRPRRTPTNREAP